MVRFRVVAVLTLSACSWHAHGNVPCPASIETRQGVEAEPAGWLVSVEATSSPLSSIKFSDGHPRELAWLVPDVMTRTMDEWRFRPSERGYWVTCTYAGTRVVLSRRLEPGTRRCRATLDSSVTPPSLVRYQCD